MKRGVPSENQGWLLSESTGQVILHVKPGLREGKPLPEVQSLRGDVCPSPSHGEDERPSVPERPDTGECGVPPAQKAEVFRLLLGG